MSMTVLGFADELREQGIAVNALWPRTLIETAALGMLGKAAGAGWSPQIMADAAHVILTREGRSCTSNFFIDEDVLRLAGMADFEHYAIKQGVPLTEDLFIS
ncbi:hypothetical protein [Methylobacterium sp. ARG-1]|uniref:hypothetical protein n=1 Tax=Methylobacterium sp. ARG-1 TaxID=1692501 RepID=UPI003297E69F